MTTRLDETPTEELLDGRYRLGDCVGRGGTAIVYRAEDVTLDRTVAVKIMRAGTDGPGAGARTRREMAALAAIDHPCLVTLLDAKILPGGPEYLVMDYVDGRSLRERLDEDTPLTGGEFTDLASDLADALSAVHGAGIVHRDVKPSNVLLASTGVGTRPVRAKLADFGIAQLVTGSPANAPAMALGTPAYVAPEQARGAAPAPSADIFAFGVVLVESLTGRRPYTNLTPAEAIAARQSVPPELPDWLDADWAKLLHRMTALDPHARPSAAEVADVARRLNPPVPITRGDRTERDTATPAAASAVSGSGEPSPRRVRRWRRLRVFGEIGAGSNAALGVPKKETPH
ncbi:serine/threonine-protein kinase [Microbacterium sp.]|uniref:serine/threonine-protein kinase n=1 Tax=Microbacterium sp. TaxID=51671 RepID=UPI002810EC0C|nr:serine/threonine-protein kinase [Microbacterium sp.]